MLLLKSCVRPPASATLYPPAWLPAVPYRGSVGRPLSCLTITIPVMRPGMLPVMLPRGNASGRLQVCETFVGRMCFTYSDATSAASAR